MMGYGLLIGLSSYKEADGPLFALSFYSSFQFWYVQLIFGKYSQLATHVAGHWTGTALPFAYLIMQVADLDGEHHEKASHFQ